MEILLISALLGAIIGIELSIIVKEYEKFDKMRMLNFLEFLGVFFWMGSFIIIGELLTQLIIN
jgi:hypothetical protein